MSEYKQLEYPKQLELFYKRGMQFNYSFDNLDKNYNVSYLKNLRTISTLGYYQLKDYAYPYFKNGKYRDIFFSDVVARYYRDKRLRNAVEHAIEDIETTLNTRIAFLLGKKYGPFGYLDFREWCQTFGYNKYLGKKGTKIDKYVIAKEQNNFLKMIQSKARHSASKDVKKFDSENKEQVYLPIWLIMNELTLGDSIHIVKLMTEKNKRLLAKQFNCKAVELIKWLDCINLVRNVCCHNGNLIDIRFKTKPKIPKGFENFLVSYKSNGGELVYTNRLSIAICIIVKLMGSINIKYRFGNLINSINHLIDTTNTPQAYGFKNRKSIYDCFSAMTISEKPQS